MKYFSCLILIALINSASLVSAGEVADKAFTYGEQLRYKVSYNLYFNMSVGEVTFEVGEDPRTIVGDEHYHVVSIGETFRFYDRIFKVRDRHESFINTNTLLPRIFIRDIYEGGYESFDHVVFDHSRGIARENGSKELEIPDETHDMVSVLYYARHFDFEGAEPGDSFMVDTYLSGDIYNLGAVYQGKEEIKTELGTFRTLKLQPILLTGRVFEADTGMMLYVTDDANRVPVRITSGIRVGSISADLVEAENMLHDFTSRIK